MDIQIDRTCGIPIYIQLKKQIKGLIEQGILSKGDRLPPERELAGKLKISRNRISAAYRELEAEQIVSSQQGKGTFVTDTIIFKEASRKDRLLKIIDLAMDEAINLGFTLNDFLTIAYVQARKREEIMSKIKVAFIECNQEQLSVLINESALGGNIVSIPLLLSAVKQETARMRNLLSRVEVIVTTSFHREEVAEYLGDLGKQVLELIVEPKMSTIVELARIEPASRVGLICLSENFAEEVVKSLKKIGLNNLALQYTTNKGNQLNLFIKEQDLVITSPDRFKEIKKIIRDEKKIISFDFAPDRGSIKLLKMALYDLKGSKEQHQ